MSSENGHGLGNGNNGNGRDGGGRFAAGNPGGPGRPKSLHRATLRRCITMADIEKAVEVLRKLMNSKDERMRFDAAREMLNRGSGRPTADDLVDRVEILEEAQSNVNPQAN